MCVWRARAQLIFNIKVNFPNLKKNYSTKTVKLIWQWLCTCTLRTSLVLQEWPLVFIGKRLYSENRPQTSTCTRFDNGCCPYSQSMKISASSWWISSTRRQLEALSSQNEHRKQFNPLDSVIIKCSVSVSVMFHISDLQTILHILSLDDKGLACQWRENFQYLFYSETFGCIIFEYVLYLFISCCCCFSPGWQTHEVWCSVGNYVQALLHE